jgi:glycosyltransferase involved in cell wall biosynthesis
MKVVMDALILDRTPSGIGQYIRHLAPYLAARHPDDEWWAMVRTGFALPGFRNVALAPERLSNFGRLVTEQLRAPGWLRRTGYDVVHFPDYRAPLTPLPRLVLTVHDLAVLRYPETFTRVQRQVKVAFLRRSTTRAAHVIVPSRATRDDLVDLLDIPPDRIAVVPHGVEPAQPTVALSPHPRPYLLFVGTLEPRKNLVRLIEGYAQVAERRADMPDLILIGRPGWLYQATFEAARRTKVGDRVLFLGYVANDALPTWYRHAVGFCFPSLYEGFGMPVLEAMAYGCPVLTADRGATKEVAEGAALLVDPDSVDAIAHGIERLVSDHTLVTTLRAAGWERARQHSWEAAADATYAVYRTVAGLD